MHVLIVGITGSGKTQAARGLIRSYRRPSLVYDPLRSPGWPTEYVWSDGARFLRAVAQARECNVFVDESPELVGGRSPDSKWIATQARHLGHTVHFLAQRPSLLSPTVRGQCSHVIAFRISYTDAAILADERACRQLEEAPELPIPGSFLYAAPNGKVYRGSLDGRGRLVYAEGYATSSAGADSARAARGRPRLAAVGGRSVQLEEGEE